MSRNDFIKLGHIDTSAATQNFVKLLEDNKTYFLNGKWGSGKTEFLEEAKRYTKKKFVIVDFWKLNDSRTTIEIAFAKLHPNYYWGIRCLMVFLVAISILMTNVVNLGLSQIFPNWIVKFAGVLALFVAVYQFFKAKTDGFYSSLLTSKYVSLSNKILVIDDFDRLSEKQQEEAYKLFSLLKGRLPIVFVGDIELIHVVKENYLSKIIDRRVELPFDLHPSNIWDDYFVILEHKLGTELPYDFKNHIRSENRNLRDREHFNDYVNQEFFARGKLGHVQIEQQLWVIYIYLFHSNLYKDLVEEKLIKVDDNEKADFTEIMKLGPTIKESIQKIQQYDNKEYPVCFNKNKNAYFLYESTSNRTSDEMATFFEYRGEEFIDKLRDSSQSSDFYQYLASQFRYFSDEKQDSLIRLVIRESMKFYNSPSMEYIIHEKFKKAFPIYERREPDDEETIFKIIDTWKDLLESENLDISERIYFFQKYRLLSFHELGIAYPDLERELKNIGSFKRGDFLVLTYLSSLNIWEKFDEWNEFIWKTVNSLNDHQFLSFWIVQSIISNKMGIKEFDYIPPDKTYILWTGRYEFDNPYKFTDYTKKVISKISSRLSILESNGFTFKRKDDTRYKIDLE